jgi:hypothetical protein
MNRKLKSMASLSLHSMDFNFSNNSQFFSFSALKILQIVDLPLHYYHISNSKDQNHGLEEINDSIA